MRFISELAFACMLLAFFSGAGRGQGKIWEVAANSTGNRLVLTVENTGGTKTETINLIVEKAPGYLHFQPTELILEPLAANESQEALLQFSVDRSAPMGNVDNIVVTLTSSTGSWQKELSFTYLQPTSCKLEQNFPNPFNPSTTIQYQLPTAGRVTLMLYDVLGREVVTLVEEHQQAGYYGAVWDAQTVASGVFFYRLVVRGEDGSSYGSIKKMILVK